MKRFFLMMLYMAFIYGVGVLAIHYVKMDPIIDQRQTPPSREAP